VPGNLARAWQPSQTEFRAEASGGVVRLRTVVVDKNVHEAPHGCLGRTETGWRPSTLRCVQFEIARVVCRLGFLVD
jgi:hypothetical protein